MFQDRSLQKQIFAIAMLLFLILPIQAFSQSGTSSLRGTIKDPSGAVVQGAAITATNTETKVDTKTKSDSNGSYSFPSLQPGVYTLVIEAKGFNTHEMKKIELTASGSLVSDLKLTSIKVGETKVRVEETASPTLVLTTEPSTGTVLDATTIQRLPTTTNDVMDLINAIGGVIPDSTFGGNNQMLGGTAAPGIAVIRDGINVNEVRWDSGIQTPSRINTELVQEIKVILAPADAEYGRGAGQVQITTKQGGNNFHGTLLYDIQNSFMNARRSSGYYTNNYNNQHNYNTSFSGPIIKEKLFYYINWDQTFANNRSDLAPVVLTPCARKGIFRYFPGFNGANASAGTTGASRRTVNSTGVPLDQEFVQDDQFPIKYWQGSTTNPAKLSFVSAFGPLDQTALDQLAQDKINCSKYDPYTYLGVGNTTNFWETNSTTPKYRSLNATNTIKRFGELMPLPNNYSYAPGNVQFGGDGLNTAVAMWTQKNKGTGTVYQTGGGQNNRANINTNINYNYSERHRMGLNYMTELTSGADATKNWPDSGYDGSAKRTPHQIGVNIQSTLKMNMLNEARIGLARTVSHSFSPLKNPDNGDKVDKMLRYLVDTSDFEDYKNLPLIVGLGGEKPASLYATTSTISFSPEGNGGFSWSYPTTPSHPYGSKNGYLIATFGGADNRWTITDNFTWMQGSHSVRIGGDIRLTRSYQETDGPATMTGYSNSRTSGLSYPVAFGGFTDWSTPTWTYPTNTGLVGTLSFTQLTGGGTTNASTGSSGMMVDFLTYMSGSISNIRQMYFVNQPFERRWNDVINKGETTQITDLRQKEMAFFAKDDWRARPGLTLNLGVRWEYYGQPWAANGMTVGLQGGPDSMFGVTGRGIGDWMPAFPQDRGEAYQTKQAFIGPNSPSPYQKIFSQDFNNFGPAVGFSYQLPWLGRNKTVVRGGYQLSYRTVGNMGSGFGASMANVSGTTYAHYFRGNQDIPYLSVDNLKYFVPTNKWLDPAIVPMDTLKIKNHGTSLTAYDYNVRNPYSQSLNLSITRTITNNITLDVRYVGTLARKGIGGINLNTPNAFKNVNLFNALTDVRAGKPSDYFNNMFKGIQFPQTASTLGIIPAVCGTEVGGCTGTWTGAAFVRAKWGTQLASGDFASIATGIADLNYDKESQVSYYNTSLQLVKTDYNTNLPAQPYGEKGTVLRIQNLGTNPYNQSAVGMFPENYILANPQLSTAEYRSNLIHSNYHSMQVQVLVRPARGISFTSTYTFAKNLADQPGGGSFWSSGGWTDPTNRALDYRLSNTRKHQWNTYGYMDLPFGANGFFFRNVKNEILSRAVEGWQLSWTISMQSGNPSQITADKGHLYNTTTTLMNLNPAAAASAPGTSNLLGGNSAIGSAYYYGTGNSARYVTGPDPQCGDTNIVGTGSTAACNTNLLALYLYDSTKPSNRGQLILSHPLPGQTGTFNNFIEGPGTITFNASVGKELRLTEGKALIFRVDCTNVMNHPEYDTAGFNSSFSYTNAWVIGTDFGRFSRREGNRTFQARMNLRY